MRNIFNKEKLEVRYKWMCNIILKLQGLANDAEIQLEVDYWSGNQTVASN